MNAQTPTALAAALGLTALLASCDLRLDTDDGSISVRWDAPSEVDEVLVVGDGEVEVYLVPALRRATVTADTGGSLTGVALDVSGARLSLVGAPPAGTVALVETPRLDRVRVVGGAHVAVYGIDGGRLGLELVGDGHLSAVGWTRAVGIDVRGNGVVAASRLWADAGTAHVEDRGLVEICARGGLDATVGTEATLVRRCQD